MPLQSNRLLIELSSEASEKILLEGIDVWLRLGLISDAEVKRLCRENLCSTIPNLISPITEVTLIRSSNLSHASQKQLLPATISKTVQMLQYLMAEFSLMWLLFLGVFMVVVSSGVLAVSQWRQFPLQGQYLILFSYTVAFWVASVWTGRRENLRLTSHVLKITTLLIIPVNFWMIDQSKLWTSGLGLAIAAIAASLLTVIIIRLVKISNVTSVNVREPLWILVNSVCLSWLHWGWGWAGFPLVATYIGTVGTATLFYLDRNKPSSSKTPRGHLSLGTIAVASATLLLLVRAIFVAKVPVYQLGAGIGICGWLFCWLSRQNPKRGMSNTPVVIAGSILLLVGWFVSVTAPNPWQWQAIAVSGLKLWLLIARFRQWWQVRDLTAIFLLGLQSVWVLWRVIPAEIQKNIIDITNRVAGTTFVPWVMVGVALFPYVVLTLFLAAQMRKWQKPALANHAEFLALVLGLVLTSLSLTNPLVRSLNLLLSSLTLAVVTQKRSTPPAALIYATHITGVTAIASGIALLLPNIGIRAWTGILLGGMIAEWSFSIGSSWRLWRRSAWHIGLVLAAISYSFLLSTTLVLSDSSVWSWGLMGLAIPVTLTVIASYPQFNQRQLASLLSVLGLFLIQILTFGAAAPQLISLGIATILMLLNTRQLQFVLPAVLTVGFALAFSAEAISTVFSKLSFGLALDILAIAPFALWLLRQELSLRHSTLARIYTQATDGWASTIASFNLLILSFYVLFLYIIPAKAAWEIIIAATLITIAIIYRTLASSKVGFYGIGWGLEILVAAIATLTAQPLVNLAISNLALGLTCQLIGDWWIGRSNQSYRFSWHVIPLAYAVLGFLLQHSSFTASTGLFTLGAALIGIGVSRRHHSFKVLTYLSLLGVSIAAYELLVYQLQQTQGGSIADGLVILASLGTAIALSERWLTRWLVLYLRIKSAELHIIADLHWAGGSGLIGLALLSSPNFGGVVVIAVLGIYALLQGRFTEAKANSFGEAWVYAGIIEAVGAISFLLRLMYPKSEWLIAWSAAIACVFAYGMYALPWHIWGWSISPWRLLAYILPGFFVYLSIGQIAIQGLLIVAAFYAWMAKSGNIRLSYISIVLADWAIVRLLGIYGLNDPLWYAKVLGLSLLYVAQIEPGLQAATEKEKRHLLRCLATGLICLTVLYQSEANLLLGLLTICFSIGFILLGLALRVRAFLYVGTVTFILQVLRHLWFFIDDYSLLLWSMGIVLGIAFIWIAANFESHRAQTTSTLRGWVTELEDWD